MIKNLQGIQREYFSIIDDFLHNATDGLHKSVGTSYELIEQLKSSPSQANGADKAFEIAFTALQNFYTEHETILFSGARDIGGMKIVLGGSSRFTDSQFDSVRKMLMYVDTILIPDPILPWVESAREEEQFKFVHFLKNAFTLWKLKPIVDAPLHDMPILVFPSWEKRLEENDKITQQRITALSVELLGRLLEESFVDIGDLFKYSDSRGAHLLGVLHKQGLLITPDGTMDQSPEDFLASYREYCKTYRAGVAATLPEKIPDGAVAILAFTERIAPQFHLLENSAELHSHPMPCTPASERYYSALSNTLSDRLEKQSYVKPASVSILKALNSKKLSWLGNIPVEALVELRKNNENEKFRSKLGHYCQELSAAELDDIDRIAAHVGRGIDSLLNEHQKEIQSIQDRYQHLYLTTGIAAWITVAAAFVPALAPFAGKLFASSAIAATYLGEKLKERADTKAIAKSLLGMLAAANQKRED